MEKKAAEEPLFTDQLQQPEEVGLTCPDQVQNSDYTNVDSSANFENLLERIGGHGKFQIFLWVSMLTQTPIAAMFQYMSFAGVTPDFWCTSLGSETHRSPSGDQAEWVRASQANISLHQTCDVNGSVCTEFVFDDSLNTVVSEWTLVCDQRWISAAITSVQMAGMLIGSLIIGQVADIWGRRKPCIAAMIGQIVFGLANAFSPNWIFFMVTRFMLGLTSGTYFIPYTTLVLEFTDKDWRTFVGGVPSWPVGGGLMALAAWLVPDWKYLGIIISLSSVPCLLFWWFIPESIRWLLAHDRIKEAQATIQKVAKWNSRAAPDIDWTRQLASAECSQSRSQRMFSIIDIYRSTELGIRASLFFFIWCSSGAVYYFLIFGAETLSGNLYLNIAIMTLIEAPAGIISAYLNNKIGRRWTSCVLYMLTAVSSAIVIVLKFTGAPGAVTNAMIFVSKLSVGGGWMSMITFTVESFPTVVRSIGLSSCSVAARVGAIVAPQLVFLYSAHPTAPYIVATLMTMACALIFLTIRETNKRSIDDYLPSAKSVKSISASAKTPKEA